MSRRRILIASDIHWCHIEWYGVKTEDRMERFVRHVEEEYERDPFEALLLLGDYSLDHWQWDIKGSWLANGVSYTKILVERLMPRLKKLGVPICMIAGNHEQYGNALWQEITGGFTRTDSLVLGDYLFILPDTFGANLDPTEHSDGTYCGTDMELVNGLMAKHPDKRVILCAHHFEPSRESEDFRTLVREDPRVLCLIGGHVHRSTVVDLGPEWGEKSLLYTGNYSYNGGGRPPMDSMWGFRDLVLEDGHLTSRYITPENDYTYKKEAMHQSYGYQDIYEREL